MWYSPMFLLILLIILFKARDVFIHMEFTSHSMGNYVSKKNVAAIFFFILFASIQFETLAQTIVFQLAGIKKGNQNTS